MARSALRTAGSATTQRTDGAPDLPAGRRVRLPGRGDTFVRELPGPAGAPTIVLLHGWTSTADLNWFTSFAALGRHFRVVALDHRGHGRGIRGDEPFSLASCADDVAALIRELGLTRVIVAGYSMGGPIAQLTWKRHRNLVDGLVLCATSTVFNVASKDRMMFEVLEGLARLARAGRSQSFVRATLRSLAAAKARSRMPGAWALEQISRHDWFHVLDAGRALGRFDSRPWLGDVDVPTAVVTTLTDEVVPLDRQIAMARSIESATVHPVPVGHAACFDAEHFVPALLDACRSVAGRLVTSTRSVPTVAALAA